jgi:hypothetical protein
MNEVNNEFSVMPAGSFSVVSSNELVQFEGGLLPLVYGLAFGVGMVAGFVANGGLEGGGGGEVLPGFTEFLVKTQRIRCGC